MTTQPPGLRMEVQGFFKLEAVNEETGERRLLADWFPNLILNQGLERIGVATGAGVQPNILSAAHVGSGSTAPAATDTALQTPVAATTNVQSTTSTYVAGPPAYTNGVVTYRFATGTAAGNLSEVGVGWGTGTSNLFSRSLIKDGSGNPTTITVLSSEALDLSYEFRLYPPGDVTGSITISGTSYSYTIRPQQISNTTWWAAFAWTTYGPYPGTNTGSFTWAYDGGIGSSTSTPSGNSFSSSSISFTIAAYSSNSYKLGATLTFGLNDANFTGGIKSISAPFYGSSTWQMEFTPKIDKTPTKVLTLNFEVSWARRP